jgi:hypothetical protein
MASLTFDFDTTLLAHNCDNCLMTYSLACPEASYYCSHVIQRNSEEEGEVMQKARGDAQEAHEMQHSDFTSEITKKLRSLIRQT